LDGPCKDIVKRSILKYWGCLQDDADVIAEDARTPSVAGKGVRSTVSSSASSDPSESPDSSGLSSPSDSRADSEDKVENESENDSTSPNN